MNSVQNEDRRQENLDAYLNRACEAEARGEVAEAERLLKLALDCEGTPPSGVGKTNDYIQQAGPVSQQDQAVIPAATLPAKVSEIIDPVSQG